MNLSSLAVSLLYVLTTAGSRETERRDLQLFESLPCFPSTKPETFILYATGDVPYSDLEVVGLRKQISSLPGDAELVLHVGDIRKGTATPCPSRDYELVHGILNQSSAPLLVVLGDNEWNDCPNVDEAYSHWKQYFGTMERQWPSLESFLVRDPVYSEVFSVVQKGVLVIGLNLVGGRLHDSSEWQTRLAYQSNRVRELVLEYWEQTGDAAKVILMGHADPKVRHNGFFVPLQNFIANELKNQVPILYLNGDAHLFKYEPNFLNQPSLLRVMVQGGVTEAPIRIQVNLNVNSKDPAQTFTVLRDAYPWRD